MCIYPIYFIYVYIYCHILFYFLFIDFFIQFFFIDSYKERCIKYVWWNWSFAELLRNMFHVWNLSFPLGTSHLRQIQIDLQAEKDPKEKTAPIFRRVTRWRFMNSAVFRFTDNRTRIRAALGGIDGQSSPIVDIDVDWSEGCGSRPSKQSNLSVDSPSHVACARGRIFVTNRRATVSQVRWFHFVSPDSRTGLPQLFPDHGNFVGSISCSRRSGDGDK